MKNDLEELINKNKQMFEDIKFRQMLQERADEVRDMKGLIIIRPIIFYTIYHANTAKYLNCNVSEEVFKLLKEGN